ncbi:hypothetical protein CAEBREN_02776 [Caenorhabditis brenneri]|uniref:Uncharacterized protein n=1 Tax=Caenorhabditis brenneri TaxID=135651 RepID=G0NJV5_CAEBE|nr:hypothetical protein CAEBREN_02776 [Caenorhabditis brenneri]
MIRKVDVKDTEETYEEWIKVFVDAVAAFKENDEVQTNLVVGLGSIIPYMRTDMYRVLYERIVSTRTKRFCRNALCARLREAKGDDCSFILDLFPQQCDYQKSGPLQIS